MGPFGRRIRGGRKNLGFRAHRHRLLMGVGWGLVHKFTEQGSLRGVFYGQEPNYVE